MYIETFQEEDLTAFFTDREGSSASPYMNEDVRSALQLTDTPWVRIHQVHKDRIAVIEDRPEGDVVLEDYDALITNVPGLVLVTVHADCIPVQLYDPDQRVIAAVHAGWRGTALGIAGKAARQMRDRFGCRNIQAYIGPGISLCCFEVGPEVIEAFQERYEACIEGDHVDLKAINRMQLEAEGVRSIQVSDQCTFCSSRFVSYRRDSGTDQRMASGICMR